MLYLDEMDLIKTILHHLEFLNVVFIKLYLRTCSLSCSVCCVGVLLTSCGLCANYNNCTWTDLNGIQNRQQYCNAGAVSPSQTCLVVVAQLLELADLTHTGEQMEPLLNEPPSHPHFITCLISTDSLLKHTVVLRCLWKGFFIIFIFFTASPLQIKHLLQFGWYLSFLSASLLSPADTPLI